MIEVTGYKTEWSGLVEIKDATFTVVEGETFVAEALDVSEDFANEANMSKRVVLKGATVAPANEEGAAFLYNWDGSGAEGSNNDLYFNVELGGETYTLTVESDECPEGSDVYTAVTGLTVGQTLNLEGFLYWYNGPQMHVHKLEAEDRGYMTFAQFREAEMETEVTIRGAVQFSAYAPDYGNTSVYLADKDGAYYLYRMNVTEEEAAKLTEGTVIEVKGYKTEWSGLVEIKDATFTVLEDEDSYIDLPIDMSDLLGSAFADQFMAQRVILRGAKVTAANDDGAAFLYNWDGSGEAGANNDLYFNVELNGLPFTLTVESDECPEGSDAYTGVTNLKVDDMVELEGFLYWYNGPQVHVHKIYAVENYVAHPFQLKNKTGVTLVGAYFYPDGGVIGPNLLQEPWLDKDNPSEDNNYEQYVYLVRPEAEQYNWLIVTEDGQQINWQVQDVKDNFEFSFKKGLDPEKWEASLQEEAEDVEKLDEVKALGRTADGFYPGYVKIGLELKNKTEEELGITGLYLYETGGDREQYGNVIGKMRDAENGFELAVDDNGEPLSVWEPGKGGLYLFAFFIRPAAETYEVYLEFEDGSSMTVAEIPNLVYPSSAGTLSNELSFKSATDPDATKIQYDDNMEDALPYIAMSLIFGYSADDWYPAY